MADEHSSAAADESSEPAPAGEQQAHDGPASHPPTVDRPGTLLPKPAPGHPLFFISAGLMLAGGLMIQSSSGPERLDQLLRLSVALLLYHCLLVGLGITLLRRRVARESLQLFLLAALFLIDPTFTYLRLGIYRQDVGAGLLLGIGLLSLGQLSAIWWLLLRYRLQALLVPAAGYLAVLGTGLAPGRWLATSGSALPGLLCDILLASLAVALLVPRVLAGKDLQAAGLRVRHATPILAGIPLLGLVLRLGALHWIYDAPPPLQTAAPMLLAAAWVALQLHRKHWPIALACLGLAAFCVSLRPEIPGLPELEPNMWRLTLAAAALLLAVQAARLRMPGLAVCAALALGGALLGNSPGQSRERAGTALDLLQTHLLPQSGAGWGAVGVGLAFVCLLLGAVVSLRARDRHVAPTRLDAVEV